MCTSAGEMYYHTDTNQVYFCDGASLNWQALGSNWQSRAGALSPKDVGANIGIGTDAPESGFALDVNGKIRMVQTEDTDTPETAVTKQYVDERLLFEKQDGTCADGSQPVKIKWKVKHCTIPVVCTCSTAATDWVEHDDPPPTCGGGCCVADQYYSVCPSETTTAPETF